MNRYASLLLAGSLLAGCASEDAGDQKIADPIAAGEKADGKKTEVMKWQDGMIFPATIEYGIDANFDANHCELWLNGFGRGNFANGGHTVEWLEAYVSAPIDDATVVNVGMFVRTGGESPNFIVLGEEIEKDYWSTGFETFRSAANRKHDARDVAFFVDVERENGDMVRLWQSENGFNYDVEETFAMPPSDTKSLGGGSVVYANEQAPIFDQKHSCE
jgi:hypothetical protein